MAIVRRIIKTSILIHCFFSFKSSDSYLFIFFAGTYLYEYKVVLECEYNEK